MSISLSGLNNIINASSFESFLVTYKKVANINGRFSSERHGIFRIISGTCSISTNQGNNFYLRFNKSDFSILGYTEGDIYNYPWIYSTFTNPVTGSWNTYNINITGKIIVEFPYLFIEFWQPQLAQGNNISEFSFKFIGFA